ncbi:MAG: DUF763 domain-containing protein [Chloroflexi bacterium]|nr:DUF763 domain-containing protein [Chloroflexota bacterium]
MATHTPVPTAHRTGIADTPLHYGRAPRWLFSRMTLLAREMAACLVEEFGPIEVLRRLSDPYWFQAFGCVLGFDWHSSGVTTTVCGALKEGLRGAEAELGICVCGGKGRASRQTPGEIAAFGERAGRDPSPLTYASRTTAKVDSAAVQDGYQIYHHTFIFTTDGSWAVVQQGMNEANGYARRYHWLSETVASYVCEPHAAVCSDTTGATLNLVARESDLARRLLPQLAREERPERLVTELERIRRLELPRRHHLLAEDLHPRYLERTFLSAYERQPEDFEALLGTPGVGARSLRALSLIAELVYDTPVSLRDPARFSFAHGGKDGHPFPVDRQTYDRSIQALGRAVRRARLGDREKLQALRRLARLEV